MANDTSAAAITFHLGFHKTATTLVQTVYRQIGTSRAARYLTAVDPAYQPLQAMLKKGRGRRPATETAVANARERFAALVAGTRAPVLRISDENIIGFPPVSQRSPSGVPYPEMERQVALLDDLFAGHSVRYVVSTRAPAGFIYSLYCNGLVNGEFSLTFREFVDRLDPRDYRPDVLLARLAGATGNPVDAVDLELLGRDGDAFLATFVEAQDAAFCEGAAARRVNARASPMSLALLRQLAPFPSTERGRIRKWLAACPLPQAEDDRYREVTMTEEDREAIDRAAGWPG